MISYAFIDGHPFGIKHGETILDFVRRHDGEKKIPTLCDGPNLAPFGSCRMCVVDVALKSDGPKKVLASCHTPVSEGMYIETSSRRVQDLRKNIMELVLTDHPLDCLTCEVNGNCELQSVAAQVGIREVRYPEGANHLDRKKDTSHPYMRSNLSKCINCYRCIRACDEIQGEMVLSMAGRGFENRIIKGLDTNFNESPCVSCGACAQTCPTSAISDVFQSKSATGGTVTRTICTYCGVGCNLNIRSNGDKIHSIEAPWDAEVNSGHTCVKGRYAFKFYNHKDRLRSPLIRTIDGFKEVSWDEAYDYIADKLKQIQKDDGSNAIAGISSSRCTNEENYLMQKFIRAVIGTNNIDGCARVCHAPTAYGMQQSFGTGAATNSVADLDLTSCILVIGANPTHAHPVTGAKIRQKAMKGIPTIVIDPRKTDMAKIATHHLQLQPGTNVALLNMFSYYLIKNNAIDTDFITNRCENFSELESHLRALNLDELEQITGVGKSDVEAAAIAYGQADAAMSFHGLGVTEHSQGSKTVMLIANLALMTGNIGKPGAGVNPLRGQNNVQGAADMGIQPHQGAGYLDITKSEITKTYQMAYGVNVPNEIGLKIPEMFDAAEAKDLKALWIMGEDVVQSDPNSEKVKSALDNLELLVVQELFMSETAKHAHVVLPGVSFLEKNGTFYQW